MKTAHLNDRDIQLYVFDSMNCESSIIKHIDSCDFCKKVADSYKLLSKELKQQPKPILDFNLADAVVSKIPVTIEYQQTKNYSRNGVLIVMSIGVIAIALNAFNINPINIFEISSFPTYFIISVGIFITLLWSLDMMRSFNKKMNQIDFS